MKIKAAILERCNSPLVIYDDITLPELKEGQVLCKIKYAGLCHSQLMEARGKRGEDKYLPHMLGHEGVGEVVALGPGSNKFAVGDKVVLGWIKGQGIDAGGTQYPSDKGTINAGAVTTFSDFAVVSENRLVALPALISEKNAVLLGCALPTGAGIVLNQLKPAKNSTVLVFGLGGIGLSALLALSNFKPLTVIAVDIEEQKLALAKEFGASHCFKADEEGLGAFWRMFPDGVDYAVESAGKSATIEMAFSMLSKSGKCIFASHPPTGEKIKLDPHALICGKQIVGSWGGACEPDKDIPVIADIVQKFSLPIDKLLSKEYRLEQVNQALDDLENRKITRALISME